MGGDTNHILQFFSLIIMGNLTFKFKVYNNILLDYCQY